MCDIHEESITLEINDKVASISNINAGSNTNKHNNNDKFVDIAQQLNFDLSDSDLTEEQKLSLLTLLGMN